KEKAFKVITLVHAETSTGVLQPMDDIVKLADQYGVMIILDTVTSLGGVEVKMDEWGLDAAYSCSQKCIGCPPGLSPVSFSDRAVEVVKNRKHPVSSWYLDLTLLEKYWGSERVYHHTSSSTLNYALLEALRLIDEEGLQNRFERHLENHRALVAGIEALGLEMHVNPEHRLPTLNTIKIPGGIDDMKLRRFLLETFNLEIGGGLGDLKGKVWRVGLMGHSCSAENVLFFLSAISRALARQGHKTDLAAGADAAMAELNA
ncbi:MAG: aminotransferase class V-fold PLP-dependent enzyme, partial [Desulfobacterales bacterium]